MDILRNKKHATNRNWHWALDQYVSPKNSIKRCQKYMKVEEYWHGTIKNYSYDGDVSASPKICRTPKPPWFFGLQTVCHATKAGLLSSISGLLHRQCLKYLMIWCFMVIGMSKQLMKYTAKDASTDLTSKTFPAWVMKVEIPANLLAILLTIGKHYSTVGL